MLINRKAKQNLDFIVRNYSVELMFEYRLDDEMNTTSLEIAILKAFLDCNYNLKKKLIYFTY